MLSCQKNESDMENTNILKEFRATVADMTVKSVALPSVGKINWEKGDQVLVDNGIDVAVFTYNISRGVFVTERNDFALADSYTAIFPASAYAASSAVGNPKVTVSPEQSLYPNYIKDLTMVAKAGRDAVFAFQNLFSVVKIEFPADKLVSGNEGDISKIEFTSKNAVVAGNATVSGGSLAFEGSNKLLTFSVTDKNVNVDSPIYVAIPAQTYNGGFSFLFTFKDRSTFPLTCDENVTVVANEVSLQRLLTPWAAFSGGEGTVENPYLINSVADYKEFIERCTDDPTFLAKNYKQTADIDLKSAWTFVPVGTEEAPFTGSYDGNGYKLIGGTYKTQDNGEPTAMFRYTDGATLKGINLKDWDMTSKVQYLGGVVAIAKNTSFAGCSWNGKLHQSVKAAMEGHEAVTDNANFGFVGGIAAFAQGCTFTNCTFDGQISATGKCIGGITGYARNSNITKCSATVASEVYTAYHCAGSIAGAMTQNSQVSECSSAGKAASFNHCGGIVGYLQSGIVEKSVVSSSAMISGRQYNIGGIAGIMIPKEGETATVDRCTAYSDVTGQYCVGGIAGHIDGNDAGGKTNITNCTDKGGILSATGTNDSKYSLVGGIVGWLTHTNTLIIENCMSAPALITAGIQQSGQGKVTESIGGTGGIFGFNHNNKTTYVANCYTTTTLSELSYKGKTPTTSTDYTIWGLAVGRNSVANSGTAPNYYNSDNEGRGIAEGQTSANLEGVTLAQMTDGTLLKKLNDGTSGLQTENTASWTASAGAYPMLDCVIADPQPRDNKAKRVSVIGDSISSFAGYIPAGYNYHYPCADGSVTRVEQTYWWQFIYEKMSNARLDINMSYSGTAVANSDDACNRTDHWANNSFVQRYIRLGGIGNPDIVLIHGGTNDWAHGDNCPLFPGSIDCHDAAAPTSEQLAQIYALADAAQTREEIEALAHNDFCSAYVKLICLIQQQYPNAKIVCIIGDYLSEGIEKSIIGIANHYGAKYVDLLAVNGFNDDPDKTGIQPNMPKHDYTISGGCHPNAKAMTFIANKIYDELGAWLEQ